MLWLKAFHIITMIAWFAGLFYLPRLFVYHTASSDQISLDRFCTMERRLYHGIMMPAALLTTALGIWLICLNPNYYLHASWLHLKLLFVIALWVYHFYCGHLCKVFVRGENRHSSTFYRWFNEVPTVLLVVIILLVVVKPF